MEAVWIKLKELKKVKNLVKDRYQIDIMQKLWKERLDAYNIKYKFGIEEKTEYVFGKKFSEHYFVFVLYVEKGYVEKAKSVIQDNENFEEEIAFENKEDISNFESELMEKNRSFQRIFTKLIVGFFIFFEGFMLVSLIMEENITLTGAIILVILMMIGFYVIGKSDKEFK